MDFKRCRHIWRILVVVLLALVVATYGMRVSRLNQVYQQSDKLVGTLQTPIEWNGMKIQLTSAEIIASNDFDQRYSISHSGPLSESEPDQYALFSISLTKISEQEGQEWFRVEYCGAEDNGWHNLMSVEIFNSLNPNATRVSKMAVGDTQTFLLAFGLYQSAFSERTWDNLSISDISLVLSVYPEKAILQAL